MLKHRTGAHTSSTRCGGLYFYVGVQSGWVLPVLTQKLQRDKEKHRSTGGCTSFVYLDLAERVALAGERGCYAFPAETSIGSRIRIIKLLEDKLRWLF